MHRTVLKFIMHWGGKEATLRKYHRISILQYHEFGIQLYIASPSNPRLVAGRVGALKFVERNLSAAKEITLKCLPCTP